MDLSWFQFIEVILCSLSSSRFNSLEPFRTFSFIWSLSTFLARPSFILRSRWGSSNTICIDSSTIIVLLLRILKALLIVEYPRKIPLSGLFEISSAIATDVTPYTKCVKIAYVWLLFMSKCIRSFFYAFCVSRFYSGCDRLCSQCLTFYYSKTFLASLFQLSWCVWLP